VTLRVRSILPLALALGIVGLFAWLFFQQASELYVMDESDFAGVARAIAHTARPIYYRGEDLPHDAGIWHPPLYQYASGIWVWIFGTSHAAFRSFGFLCALVGATLGWLVVRRLFPEHHPRLAPIWLGLFLLNPFVVQSALLPDIDGTVLVPLSMLMIWLAAETVVAHRWLPTTASVLFGVALGLSFLAKLTTPIALVPFVGVALALAYRSWRWALGGAALAAAVASAVFCAVWGSISALANLSFTYPFTFTYSSAVTRSGHPTLGQRLHLLWPSGPVKFWLTPLLLAIFVSSSCIALYQMRRAAAQVVLLCAAYATVVFVVYNEITGPPFGFPKYYAPALGPALVVAVAPLGLIAPEIFKVQRMLRATTVAGITLAIVAVSLGAYAGYRSANARNPSALVWVAVGACALALLALVGRRMPFSGVLVLSIAAALAVLFATDVGASVYQSRQGTNVRYFPGELGEAQTVAELRRVLGSTGMRRARLLCAKDIGYETGARYYEDALYLGHPTVLAHLIANEPGMVIVTRSHFDYSEAIFPKGFSVIHQLAKPIWVSSTGDFTIWKRR
jgi:4-amino-4-deoxy-L-arabinose transferase-like glycosyltransferase